MVTILSFVNDVLYYGFTVNEAYCTVAMVMSLHTALCHKTPKVMLLGALRGISASNNW